MESNPLVSVIVPAYNAAEHIADCLYSISNQNLEDFEAIIIDDGSTDATASIVEKIAAKDPRFRIIRQLNRGVSHARNVGIDNARGKYLTFVDADDALRPKALKRMVAAMLKGSSRVCVAQLEAVDMSQSLRTLFDEVAVRELSEDLSVDIYDYEEAMEVALYQKRQMNSPCGVMMERELLGDHLRFREGIRYEDLDAFYRFYEGADTIAYLPEPHYFYRKNPRSFTNTWSDARLDVLDVTDRMVEFFRERYPAVLRAALDRRYSAHFNMLALMLRNNIDNPRALQRCMDVVREGRSRALKDRKVRMKNKIGALSSLGGVRLLRLLSKM